MTDREVEPLEPLDPGLAALVAAEREPERVPAGSRAAMLSGLMATIGPGGGAGAGAGPAASGRRVRPAAIRRAATLAKGLSVFTLGAALGAIGHARWRPATTERVVYLAAPTRPVERPPVVLAAPPPTEVTARIPDAAIGGPVVSPPRRANEREGPEARSELNAERALIDRARSAVARGDGAAALAAIEQHGRRFPRGQLIQERESLRVLALITAGRHGEARAAGAEFRRRFGDGLLWPVIESALRTIP